MHAWRAAKTSLTLCQGQCDSNNNKRAIRANKTIETTEVSERHNRKQNNNNVRNKVKRNNEKELNEKPVLTMFEEHVNLNKRM